jgi:hypothetical protein
MARGRSRIAARLRGVLSARRRGGGGAGAGARAAPPAQAIAPPAQTTAPPAHAPAAHLRGLGEPSAAAAPPGQRDQAPEAELDTLRGELVRELDRLAEGEDGSASFRRIAS